MLLELEVSSEKMMLSLREKNPTLPGLELESPDS